MNHRHMELRGLDTAGFKCTTQKKKTLYSSAVESPPVGFTLQGKTCKRKQYPIEEKTNSWSFHRNDRMIELKGRRVSSAGAKKTISSLKIH